MCQLLFLSLNFFLCLHSAYTLPRLCLHQSRIMQSLCRGYSGTRPTLRHIYYSRTSLELFHDYFFLPGLVLISATRSSFLTILYGIFLFNYVIFGLKLYIAPAFPIIEKVSHLAIFGLFYFVLLLLLFFTLLNCSF